MPRGKPHSDETRAAVMAALMAGQLPSDVAKSYKLPERTVREWFNAEEFADVRRKKDTRLGELLGQYVECNLLTLQAQSEHFRNPAWLGRQTASDLAMLHGVVADKTLRILEAAELASGE